MAANILIVDDEKLVLKALQRVFRLEGYNTYLANSGKRALEILEDIPIDLVLTDQRMPKMTGVQLLKTVKERWPETIRIIISGYADVEAILSAINVGEVYRFITKPWDDDSLRTVIHRALEQGKVVKIFNRLIQRLREKATDRLVEARAYTDQGRMHAEIQDHGMGMSEKQIACVLQCIFEFFESADENGDVAMLSSTLTKHTGKLSFTTEVGYGAQLTVDMPIEGESGGK